jgi:hypothetical protein
MLFAIVVALFLLTFAFLILSSQNNYWRVGLKPNKHVKEKIVKLPVQNITNVKLLKEIKIFNSLFLIMPVCHGVSVAYTGQILALLANPKHRPPDDPYIKLLYGYACFVLANKTYNFTVRRQLQKNLLFLLGTNNKIVKKINPIWASKKYFVYPPVPYKIFNNSVVDFSATDFKTVRPLKTIICSSYIKYQNADIMIRRFDGFYELYANTEQQISFVVDADKENFDVRIACSTVHCKDLKTGREQKYTIRGDKFRLTTSVCEKIDALEIHILFAGGITVKINNGTKKMLSKTEIEFNRRVEQIVTRAYVSKSISGENLRSRYKLTEKVIPSFRLFTAVYEIADAEIFLSVMDDLECYKKAAVLFGGFNIVFLYSSGNDFVASLVAGFINGNDIEELSKLKVFMFFVDRITVSADAIYFLSRMAKKSGDYIAPARLCTDNKYVQIGEKVQKSFPYTRTIVLQNTQSKAVAVSATVPISFNNLSIVAKNGNNITVTGLYSGKVSVYKLPPAAVLDMSKEILADIISIQIKTKIMGFEQKRFVIHKNNDVLTVKERRDNFIHSVQNIVVKSDDKEFKKIFTLPIADGESPQILYAVKSAYRSLDRSLLLSILSSRNEITADIWEFLMTKVVGLHWVKGRIHLVPNVNITGDFSLNFTCNGESYSFSTKQDKYFAKLRTYDILNNMEV